MSFKSEVSPKIISLVFGILIISFLAVFYVFAWTEPGSPPPGGNVFLPLNTSNNGQVKIGGLIINSGGAPNGLIVDKGNVGIGTATPSQALDLASGNLTTTGSINANAYKSNGIAGYNGIIAVKGLGGIDCNITVANGIITGFVCP